MKKFIVVLLFLLFACSEKLPLPELSEGKRGELGIDKNINEETIDNYLNRSDSVYIDCRMLEDVANFEAIGIDSNLDGIVKGFEVIPYPYLCNPILPDEVGQGYMGKSLFSQNSDGTYSANYLESEKIIKQLFPKNKNIFLMCGGGGYAGMCKQLLVYLGYDANKIYNVGGYAYYEGNNKIETRQSDGTYDYSNIIYHNIDFEQLTPIDGYNPDINIEISPRNSKIKIIENIDDLIEQKKDFILLVSLESCTSCLEFKPIVEELAEKITVEVYQISLENIKEEIPKLKYTPSIVIYKQGVLQAFLDAQSDKDKKYYTNVEELSIYIKQYLDIETVNGTNIYNPDTCENACVLE